MNQNQGGDASVQNSQKRITLISPSACAEEASWTAKFERVVRDSGYQYQYWGWSRADKCAQKASNDKTWKRILLSGGGKRANARLMMGYLRWMLKVFGAARSDTRRPVYVAVSFDSALPLAVLSLWRKTVFVYANLDNISTSYRWPKVVKAILRKGEEFVASRCCVHLLPSATRWQRNTTKEKFLINSPTSNMIWNAKKIAERKAYNRGGRLTIYVNGYLTKTRGIGVLLAALQKCPQNLLSVLLAGQILCEEAADLAKMENVDYLGELSGDESLAIYYKSHIVFTFYDPAIEINRLAEPNKWQDCIATQTPFLVNSEVITAEVFVAKNACASVRYDDVDGVADCLKNLANDRMRWAELQANLGSFRTPAWDVGLQDILAKLPWAEVDRPECHTA